MRRRLVLIDDAQPAASRNRSCVAAALVRDGQEPAAANNPASASVGNMKGVDLLQGYVTVEHGGTRLALGRQKMSLGAGRFLSTKAALRAIDVNPTLGWQITDSFGLGIGAVARFSDVELNRNVPAINPFTQRVVDVARLNLESEFGNAYGWNVGILHKVNNSFSWGLSYRSELDIEYEGDARLTQNFTNTPFETNSQRAADPIEAYSEQSGRTAAAIAGKLKTAPPPESVAQTILRAIESNFQLRPAGTEARLLSVVRRFMPAGMVDKSLRTQFGFPR